VATKKPYSLRYPYRAFFALQSALQCSLGEILTAEENLLKALILHAKETGKLEKILADLEAKELA
jgi:hypothetical protein